MATVQRFEDLLCWKKSRELVKGVYTALKGNPDRGFTDQIQRAAVSVMSNISEGFESGTKQEFINYLYIAKASCGEVRAQLYIANDIGYLNIQIFENLKGKAEETSRLINSFIKAVKSSEHQGLQRKAELTKQEREDLQDELERLTVLAQNNPTVFAPELEKFKKGRGKSLDI
jgi:four helix bundle protein